MLLLGRNPTNVFPLGSDERAASQEEGLQSVYVSAQRVQPTSIQDSQHPLTHL